MWEYSVYILVSACCIWLVMRSRHDSARLKEEQIRERFREALCDPAISFVIVRMLRDYPVKNPRTLEEKRRAQKYNLMRARLDNLVRDREVLRRIDSFIERKRKNVKRRC